MTVTIHDRIQNFAACRPASCSTIMATTVGIPRRSGTLCAVCWSTSPLPAPSPPPAKVCRRRPAKEAANRRLDPEWERAWNVRLEGANYQRTPPPDEQGRTP